MLLLLFSIFSHYGLHHCTEDEKTFNETHLTEQLHQSLLEANAFLEDVQEKIHQGKSILRVEDYEPSTKVPESLDYSTTDIWWKDALGIGENTPQTSFLSTPKGHGLNTATPYPIGIFTIPTTQQTISRHSDYTYRDYIPKFGDSPDTYPLDPGITTSSTHKGHPTFPFSVLATGPGHTPSPPRSPAHSYKTPFVPPTLDYTFEIPSKTPFVPPTLDYTFEIHSKTPFVPPTPDYTYEIPSKTPFVPPTPDYTYEIPSKTPFVPPTPDYTYEIPSKTPFVPPYFTYDSSKPPAPRSPDAPPLPPPLLTGPAPEPPFNPDYFPEPGEFQGSKPPPFPLPELPPMPTTRFYWPTTPPSPITDYDYQESGTVSPAITMPHSTGFTTLHPNISHHVKEWLLEKMNHTALASYQWIYTPTTRIVRVTRTKTAEGGNPPAPERTHQNPAWIHNKQLDRNASRYRSRSVHREGQDYTSTPDPQWPGHPTMMGQSGKFFIDGNDGLIYLGTTPAYDENTRTTLVDGGRPAPIPFGVEIATSSTAGAVLYGKITNKTPEPKDPYKEALLAEMAEQNVWYMSIYVTHLAYLIANKDPEHVRSILIHAEPIVTKLWGTGRLAWMGQPLLNVFNRMSIALSEGEIDVIQSYAALVYGMMKSRKTAVSVDVNSIIDFADSLYEDAEGELLFDVIKELDEYPNITKSSYDLADDLLEYFLMPFRRLYNSERRQKLLDSINYALIIRFPHLEGAVRRSNEEFDLIEGVEQKPITHKKDPTKRVHSRDNKRNHIRHLRSNHSKDFPNIRPNKLNRIINKQRREDEETHSDFNYEKILRRRYTQVTPVSLMLRRMKPITHLQRRFSIITSGQRFRGLQPQQRVPSTGPSTYFIDLLATRRTTGYKPGQIKNDGGKYRVPGYNTNNNNKQLEFFHYQRGSKLKKYHEQSRNDSERPFQRYRSSINPGRDNKSFYYQMKKRYKEFEKHKNDEGLKLKDKLVQKIVDGSSYSDEEAALEMNLIDAMIHGNRSFDVDDVNMTDWLASVRSEEELWLKRLGETEDLWTSTSSSTSDEDTRDSTREHADNSI